MNYTYLSDLLHNQPDLRLIMEKVCHRYAARLDLTGTMKVGQNLQRRTIHTLQATFSLDSIQITKKGEVRILFDRFFGSGNDLEKQPWIDSLHDSLGIPKGDKKAEAQQIADSAAALLDRLKLCQPSLVAVHKYLHANFKDVCNRIARRAEDDVETMYLQAGDIVAYLLKNQKITTFSDIGARFCNNSKSLRNTELTSLVRNWMAVMEDNGIEVERDSDEIWQRYHVVKDRLAVQAVIYGPLVYEKNSVQYDWIFQLWQAGEPAVLTWQNIVDIDRIEIIESSRSHCNTLQTCENEAPFTQLIRENSKDVLLYTNGFPSDSVMALYRLLAPAMTSCKHWGDSDLAGLQIAAMLHKVFPLELWRCDLLTLKRLTDSLLSLSEKQRLDTERFFTNNQDFIFYKELGFTLQNGWLEQESWHAE